MLRREHHIYVEFEVAYVWNRETKPDYHPHRLYPGFASWFRQLSISLWLNSWDVPYNRLREEACSLGSVKNTSATDHTMKSG